MLAPGFVSSSFSDLSLTSTVYSFLYGIVVALSPTTPAEMRRRRGGERGLQTGKERKETESTPGRPHRARGVKRSDRYTFIGTPPHHSPSNSAPRLSFFGIAVSTHTAYVFLQTWIVFSQLTFNYVLYRFHIIRVHSSSV